MKMRNGRMDERREERKFAMRRAVRFGFVRRCIFREKLLPAVYRR